MRFLAFVSLILGLVSAQYVAEPMAGLGAKSAQCPKDATVFAPFFASSTCTRDCVACNACVVVIIQLGCDVIHEIEPISRSVIEVITTFKRTHNTLPGSLRVGLIRYGLARDMKIDLTLLDDINDFTNVISGVLIKNLEDMKPVTNAHPIPAFKAALQMFEDYSADRERTAQPECRDKWIWYVTNGHLQCAECICYPEIANPFVAEVTTQVVDNEKHRQFRRWVEHASVRPKLMNMCSDYMTETQNQCCLTGDDQGTCPFSPFNVPCQRSDFINCETQQAAFDRFIELITMRQACSVIDHQILLCITRSRLLAMFELDHLKCNAMHQKIGIMATAPNKAPCTYSQHNFDGQSRRVWTENKFEDCHNADMLGYLNSWNSDLGVCSAMGIAITPGRYPAPSCDAYDYTMSSRGTFHVNDDQETAVVAKCLIDSAKKCQKKECSKTDCNVDMVFPKPTPRTSIVGSRGCPGSRGPSGMTGGIGPAGAGGPRGVPGGDGAQGGCGERGLAGPDGIQQGLGEPGDMGPQGPQGPDGEPGLPGDHGMPGPDGMPGVLGKPGIQGRAGETGDFGAPGIVGPRGTQGPPGASGPQGVSGTPGIGIDSENYYRKYKELLRVELENSLQNVRIVSGQATGPAIAVQIYRQLAIVIASQINVVCRSGHDNGVCREPRPEIFHQRSPVNPICSSTESSDSDYTEGYGTTYRPTTEEPLPPVITTTTGMPTTVEPPTESEFTFTGGSTTVTTNHWDSSTSDDGWWSGKRKREIGKITKRRRVHS